MIEKKLFAASFSLGLGAIALYEALDSFSMLFYDAGFWVMFFIVPLVSGILLIRAYYGYLFSKTYFRNSMFFGSIFFILQILVFIFNFFRFGNTVTTVVHSIPADIVVVISFIFFIFIVINWNEFEVVKKDLEG